MHYRLWKIAKYLGHHYQLIKSVRKDIKLFHLVNMCEGRICLSLGPGLARSWETPHGLWAGALRNHVLGRQSPENLWNGGRLWGEGPVFCSAQSWAGTEGMETKRRFSSLITVGQLVQSLLGGFPVPMG